MKQREKRKQLYRTAAVLCSAVLAAASSEAFAGQILQVSAAAPAAELYVAPDGDDSNPGTLNAPLRSLAGARDAVRKIKGSAGGDIAVYFRGGVYRITEAVRFGVEDSAPDGTQIIYQAYENEKPVFSGAVQVTGWSKYNDKLYVANLDRDYKLRNFYINDHRANMGSAGAGAKGGYGEYYIRAGQADWAWDSGTKSDGIVYSAGDIPRVESNLDDLEVVNGTTWNENIVCSRDIKYENGNMIFLMQQPYGSIAQTPGWGAGFSCGGWHTLYNAFSFVNQPGQFYFDKTEHKLYYYPYDWEDMSTAEGEAPVTEQLVIIEGNSTTNRVKNLSFNGLTFAHTDYQLTNVAGSHGKATCQAAQTFTAFIGGTNWHHLVYDMCDTLPAAVSVNSAENINFTDNVIKHTGADGLGMINDVVHSSANHNYITDITSSGITIGHPQHEYIGDKAQRPREKYDVGVEGLCTDISVCDNLLYDISVVHGFGGCAAVTAYFGDSIRINSNQIEKTAYNGIHLGWGWCEFPDSTSTRDCQINNNRVINCLNRLHDSGGIYTINQMPGTVINENYVVGIPAGGAGAPTYGLHNDEGTAYIEENDNVLDISPNVTYTINCEDYGKKHHLTIKRTYATVRKMGINPPNSDIDDPIVVSDNVWPQRQYEICLNSGLKDEYRYLMPENMVSDANYVFPASCQTKCGNSLPIRKAGSGKIVWIAPDNTTTFKKGSTMTKAAGTATKITTPSEEGTYRIYVTDSTGKILSKSERILRLSGAGGGVDASSFSVQSGIDLENCEEGGQDVAYIEDGDYIGFKDIDFGSGPDAIDLRLASPYGNASVEIRLDGPTGKLIGTCDVENTGGWQAWVTHRASLTKTTGTHDLYLVFKGGEGFLFNIASWKLIFPTGAGPSDFIYGDIDNNGTVDARDLTLLKRAVKAGEIDDLDPADLNGSGDLDAEDVTLHQEFLLCKITKFPAMD